MDNHHCEQWFYDKLQRLNNAGNISNIAILTDFKTTLISLNQDNLKAIAKINFSVIFLCLNNDNDALLASEVLQLLLTSLEPLHILTLYGINIELALKSYNAIVKKNLLKCLINCTTLDCLVLLKTQLQGILNQVVVCLSVLDRVVAEESVLLLKKIGQAENSADILLSEPLINLMTSIMKVNDTTRFRVYEVITHVVGDSEIKIELAHRCGILSSLLLEIKSTDPLIQLNALELASTLASNNAGFLYLQRQGLINYLINCMCSIESASLSFILLPGLIEFFGNLCIHQPAVFCQQHPQVLQVLFANFDTLDPALLGVTITAIGKIGSSQEGKKALAVHENDTENFFKKLGDVIQRQDSLRVTGMRALVLLLSTQDGYLYDTTHSWFQALGFKGFSSIISSMKLPFIDERLASLELLQAISLQPWGVSAILSHPGLLEFLLDRNVEFDVNCKVTKYNVVKALVSIPTLPVNADMLSKLKQHVMEGPFVNRAEVQVTTEQE